MQISSEAREAIASAIYRKAPVSELGWLGLSTKSINRLNEAGIMTMADLMSKTPDQLLKVIRNTKKKYSFGQGSMEKLLSVLSRYHELPQQMNDYDE